MLFIPATHAPRFNQFREYLSCHGFIKKDFQGKFTIVKQHVFLWSIGWQGRIVVKINSTLSILVVLIGFLCKAKRYKSKGKHVRASDRAQVMEILIENNLPLEIRTSQSLPNFIAFNMVYIIGGGLLFLLIVLQLHLYSN